MSVWEICKQGGTIWVMGFGLGLFVSVAMGMIASVVRVAFAVMKGKE